MAYARAHSNTGEGNTLQMISFEMNADCTEASGAIQLTFGPGSQWAGQILEAAGITAVREGDNWIVTSFGTG